MVINAVQICVLSALADVPTTVFSLQVLFDRCKEDFDLPALFVNRGNRGREFQMIGQKHDFPLFLFIPNHDPA